MILLSNVIKAPFTKINRVGKKMIEIKRLDFEQPTAPDEQRENHEAAVEHAKHEAERIKREAEQYYELIRQQVQQEQEAWQTEKEQLIQSAREEGYKNGFEQGKAEALHHCRELIEQARQITETANAQFYEQINASAETILRIGIKVAERIIGEKLAENHDHFLSLVKRALKEVREQSEVTIYVHPASYETVVRRKEELKALFHHEADVFIHPDEQLEEHGCIIETPFGRIDASVDTQLEQIKEKLFERMKEGMSAELASSS
ncbi:MAG: flagellar assembly protein FliH [Geobacillus sp.]|nr:MAG: flagellar assembly protein FliH [Geobacillus sp.]